MLANFLLIALLAAGQIDTSKACEQTMDLCFINDGSSTVCGGNASCDNWNTLLKFNQDIANALDIGSQLNRVAMVTFFNACEVNWNLKKYSTKTQLLTAIGGVAYKGGVFTDVASTTIVGTQVFNIASGDNPLAKNVVLMVTDGVPGISDLEARAASTGIQAYGVTMFVIGITPGCTESWAQAVASLPTKNGLKTYFLIDSYPALDDIRETVLEQICYFLAPDPLISLNISLSVG